MISFPFSTQIFLERYRKNGTAYEVQIWKDVHTSYVQGVFTFPPNIPQPRATHSLQIGLSAELGVPNLEEKQKMEVTEPI
jgi:hypothetical protein